MMRTSTLRLNALMLCVALSCLAELLDGAPTASSQSMPAPPGGVGTTIAYKRFIRRRPSERMRDVDVVEVRHVYYVRRPTPKPITRLSDDQLELRIRCDFDPNLSECQQLQGTATTTSTSTTTTTTTTTIKPIITTTVESITEAPTTQTPLITTTLDPITTTLIPLLDLPEEESENTTTSATNDEDAVDDDYLDDDIEDNDDVNFEDDMDDKEKEEEDEYINRATNMQGSIGGLDVEGY